MTARPFLALALAACAFPAHTWAIPTAESPGISLFAAYIHSTSDPIVSYDWGSDSALYYMTSAGFPDTQIWRATGATPQNIYSEPDHFAGASVVRLGDSILFNDSTRSNQQLIHRYGPLGGGTAGLSIASTASNYSLHPYGGGLFVSAASGFDPSHIFYTPAGADGSLQNPGLQDLGEISGGSGPIAFDLAGNLFYAPGFGDLSIYRFSAQEVAAAIAATTPQLAVSGHKWLDYSAAYGAQDGATSMLLDANGDVLVTLTSFSTSSFLVRFGADESGNYNSTATTLVSDEARLGELRMYDGELHVSSGNGIYRVVPEPATAGLLGLGALALLGARRVRRGLGFFAALGCALALPTAPVQAGPYSTARGNDPAINPGAIDAGIPGFVGPAGEGVVPTASNGNTLNPLFVGWATGVAQYAPASNVSAAFREAELALGPVTGDGFDIVSLGDLSNPASSGQAPGMLTLSFAQPLFDGPGADFATFENGFLSGGGAGVAGQIFGELGYVEASSDGLSFARFPSVSLTPKKVGAYGTLDPTNVYNLVGKHVNSGGSSWGTPFDLQALAPDPLVVAGAVRLWEIRYIRIVDIPGDGTRLDSRGQPIFDAWVTTGSGGVDFEALGVIHQVPEPTAAAFTLAGLGSMLASRVRAT